MRISTRAQQGFTLIELMIVVAVLSIVAAIAIPNFLRYQAKSRQSEARTNLGGIFVAQTSFYGEQSRYGSLGEIGYVLAGQGSNRYTYRSGAALATGGANAGVIFPAPNFDTINAALGSVVAYTGPAGNAMNFDSTAIGATPGFTATAASNLDSDVTFDGWYVNNDKAGLTAPNPDDIVN